MKRTIFSVAIVMALLGIISCDKLTNSKDTLQAKKEFDFQTLSKPNEFKEYYDGILSKAGENAKVMDEVEFVIARPSVEGPIKLEGQPDNLYMHIIYQDPADKKKIEQVEYHNSLGWQEPQQKEIMVVGLNKEKYRLEDDLFDFTQISVDLLNKVIADSMAKYKDEAKYEYQYVNKLVINEENIIVSIHGKLKGSGEENTKKYVADLKGNSR